MTTLEACQEILRAVGRGTISALDTNGASDASAAERILDEIELEVQAEGWFYNLRRRLDLEPDADGHITMPDGAIVTEMTWAGNCQHPFTQLGRRLFDVRNNTDVWDKGVRAVATIRYDFECIPYPIQKYITRLACVRYNDQYGDQRNTYRRQNLSAEMLRARVLAHRFNDRASGVNVVATARMRHVRGDRIQYER